MDSNKSKNLRLIRNKEIVVKLKKGDSLATVRPEQTFFPPRPIIKKDLDALRRIYDKEKNQK